MPADGRPVERARRGFMFGELLIALLLLAVAVSSLAALMYSVSRRPTTTRAETECVVSDAARGKCVPATAPQNPETKLLRSGCATRSVFDQRQCKDSVGRRGDQAPNRFCRDGDPCQAAEGTEAIGKIRSGIPALTPASKNLGGCNFEHRRKGENAFPPFLVTLFHFPAVIHL